MSNAGFTGQVDTRWVVSSSEAHSGEAANFRLPFIILHTRATAKETGHRKLLRSTVIGFRIKFSNEFITIGSQVATKKEGWRIRNQMQVPTMMRQQPVASEMKPLQVNQVWPVNMKPFNSKWVFQRKEDGNSKLVCYKVRLVEKGFLQKQGQDYEGIST